MQKNDIKLFKISSFLLRTIGDFCNLDCSYCYYKTHKKTFSWDCSLKFKILYDIVEYVRQTKYSIKLCWHGGEPMLAGSEFFEEVVNMTDTLQERYGIPKHRIHHTIQTNATLLNQKWCDFLKNNNIGIGISFDIIESVQNNQRSNSYNKVVKAINLLNENKISFVVNSVLSQQLLMQDTKDVMQEIIKLNIINFEFSQASIQDRDHNEYNMLYANFMKKMIDVYLEYNNPRLNFRFFDSAAKELLGKKGSLCTHSASHCGDYPTIDAKGNINFCDNYDEKRYAVNDVANFKDMSLIDAMQIESYQKIRTHPRLYSKECKTCDVNDLCQGGCPRNFDQKLQHNIFCSAYKDIFSHIKIRVNDIVKTFSC
jgi:uncharacterized protein